MDQPGRLHVFDRAALVGDAAFGRLEEARDVIGRLRVDLYGAEFAYATLGLNALRRGKLEKGEALYLRALQVASPGPTKTIIRQKGNLELAKYWLNVGKTNRARRYLEKAIKEKWIAMLEYP